MQAQLKTLSNGIRLISVPFPHIRSVSLGVWAATGSCQETEQTNGISHFIEHMMFKGTNKRTAADIANFADRLGAQINAFTSKEVTCYYTKSIDEDIESCFDLLSDMYQNSTLSEEELKREKGVVIEEISMTEDNPEELCHELLASLAFKGSTLGMPIAGTISNVNSFSREDLSKYIKEKYTTDNTVVVVCGNITHKRAEELASKYFCTMPSSKASVISVPTQIFTPHISCKIKDIEQANIGIAFPSFEYASKNADAASLLSNILGGCMSSRLFQEVREKRGLCYSVYSFGSVYKNNASLGIFTATNPKTAKDAVKTIRNVLDSLIKNGVTEEEFARAKAQVKSALIMVTENTSAVMNSYGKYFCLTGRLFDIDEKISIFNSLTIDDVNQIIPQIFRYELANACHVGKEDNCNIFQPLQK